MKGIKHKLQNLINGNGQVGATSQLKKVQNFLGGYAQTSARLEKQKYLKSEEEKLLTITLTLTYHQEIIPGIRHDTHLIDVADSPTSVGDGLN